MPERGSAAHGRWPEGALFTVGHSTRPVARFLAVLANYGIERLADVRTIPRSRHNPQFNSDALEGALEAAGIAYVPMPALGGLRRPAKDSPNSGWRHTGFRGYADYMQTAAFAEALDRLIRMSREKRTAIMCAEAVPWRCHRSLVADAMTVRGVPVIEILTESHWRLHSLTRFAHVENGRITYPAEQQTLL